MAVGHIIAEVGGRMEILTVDATVEEVFNSKIPDLLEVLEKARGAYLGRYDALVLRQEGELLELAARLKALCLRIACEQILDDLEDEFDELWDKLNNEFNIFSDYCGTLGIYLSDNECLVLMEFGDPPSPNGKVESSSSYADTAEGGIE